MYKTGKFELLTNPENVYIYGWRARNVCDMMYVDAYVTRIHIKPGGVVCPYRTWTRPVTR